MWKHCRELFSLYLVILFYFCDFELIIWNPNPRNFCLWNPESRIKFKEFGTPQTIGIPNPSSSNKESDIQYLKSGIHSVKSRIQHCRGLQSNLRLRPPLYNGHFFSSPPDKKSIHWLFLKFLYNGHFLLRRRRGEGGGGWGGYLG